MEITIVIALSLACGILYRMGGSKDWDTKFRDAGSAAAMIGTIVVLFGIPGSKEVGSINILWGIIVLLASFGLMWGALTTYRYFLKKPANYTCWYYLMHGFFVALAIFPWAFYSGHMIDMAIRCVLCAALVSVWSGVIGNDVAEEIGRGIIMCASLYAMKFIPL